MLYSICKNKSCLAFQHFVSGDCLIILDYPVPRGWRSEQVASITKTMAAAEDIAKRHNSKASLMAVAHGYNKDSLLASVSRLSQIDGLDSIAISHKEIPGASLADSFAIMHAAKREMSKHSESEKSLHVLAPGDITNWLFFSLLGVDTFDSTNWIDKIAYLDGHTWATFDQITSSDSCTCKVCISSGMTLNEVCKTPPKRMSHNLEVSTIILNQIRTELEDHQLHKLVTKKAPDTCNKLEALLGKGLHSLYEDR